MRTLIRILLATLVIWLLSAAVLTWIVVEIESGCWPGGRWEMTSKCWDGSDDGHNDVFTGSDSIGGAVTWSVIAGAVPALLTALVMVLVWWDNRPGRPPSMPTGI